MNRTLSTNEAKIVLELEWRSKNTVTLTELHAAFGTSEGYARYMAHRLAKKGWLERIRPGLYQFIPAARGCEGVADMNPLTVGALLVSPYFFSFGTACTHHGFTEQVFTEVYIACRKRRKAKTLRGKRFVFAFVSEHHFFGFDQTAVLGQPVQMATPERTLLDAVHRPRYAGGIGEVSRIVGRAASRISWEKLLDLLRRWGGSALSQRLGFFLDLHQVELPPEVRSRLLALLSAGSKVHLGSRRQWGTSGRLRLPWNVVENVPPEVLKEKAEPRKITLHTMGNRRDQ